MPTISRKQISFQIRDTEDLRFKQEVRLDLIWLDGKPVLHILDACTNFSAARFLPAEDTATVWNTLLKAWAHLYVGFLESLLVDQGSVFLSDECEGACQSSQIELRTTGVRSHNSFGAGETYHFLLRRIFNEAKMDHPELTKELVLSLSEKAMNDTAGPDSLVPTLLVLSTILRSPSLNSESTAQKERLRALKTAGSEHRKAMAESRLRKALQKNLLQLLTFAFSLDSQSMSSTKRKVSGQGPTLSFSATRQRSL